MIKYRLWHYGLWSFQAGGTKLERFWPKNQHTLRKFLNFENWTKGELRSLQKSDYFILPSILLPKLRLVAQWVEKTLIYIFSIFGSKINEFERKKIQKKNSKNLKNLKVAGNYPNASYSIFLHEGLKKSTLKTLIFESYWGSQLVQFSKFKNFLWVCWILGKNLWFCTPRSKTPQPMSP